MCVCGCVYERVVRTEIAQRIHSIGCSYEYIYKNRISTCKKCQLFDCANWYTHIILVNFLLNGDLWSHHCTQSANQSTRQYNVYFRFDEEALYTIPIVMQRLSEEFDRPIFDINHLSAKFDTHTFGRRTRELQISITAEPVYSIKLHAYCYMIPFKWWPNYYEMRQWYFRAILHHTQELWLVLYKRWTCCENGWIVDISTKLWAVVLFTEHSEIIRLLRYSWHFWKVHC